MMFERKKLITLEYKCEDSFIIRMLLSTNRIKFYRQFETISEGKIQCKLYTTPSKYCKLTSLLSNMEIYFR